VDISQGHIRTKSSQVLNTQRQVIAPITGPENGLHIAGNSPGQADPGREVFEIKNISSALSVSENWRRWVYLIWSWGIFIDFAFAIFGGHPVIAQTQVNSQSFERCPLIIKEATNLVSSSHCQEWIEPDLTVIENQSGCSIPTIQIVDILRPGSRIGKVGIIVEIATHPVATAFGILDAEFDIMFTQEMLSIIRNISLQCVAAWLLSLDVGHSSIDSIGCPFPPVDIAGMVRGIIRNKRLIISPETQPFNSEDCFARSHPLPLGGNTVGFTVLAITHGRIPMRIPGPTVTFIFFIMVSNPGTVIGPWLGC